eukprot:3091851-Rhodomonas_salina.2
MAHTGSFNDLTSSHLGSENSAQYTELRNLLLEVSAVLLDPSPGQDDASEAVSSFNLKRSDPADPGWHAVWRVQGLMSSA